MAIRTSDPELYSLMSGEASATLVADALSGSISPVKPDVGEVEAAKIAARKQQLFDRDPFKSGNITEQLELAAIDEKLAEKMKADAAKGSPDEQQLRHERLRAQTEKAEARAASLNHGSALSGASYHRLKQLEASKQWMNTRYRVGA